MSLEELANLFDAFPASPYFSFPRCLAKCPQFAISVLCELEKDHEGPHFSRLNPLATEVHWEKI